MKKTLFFLGSIGILIAVFFSGCDTGTADTGEGTTLVCFGDSLTAGYGASVPKIDDRTKSYPAYLQNKVNIPVINAGVSGDTTAQALARINRDVLSKNPRIVIIELGANDVLWGIPLQTTENNLRRIINLINNGRRKIYITKFYTEEAARELANIIGIGDFLLQTRITQYDKMFDTLAASDNVELIDDIWKEIWGIHMSDRVHPNARGYEIMADNYYNAIKPYLEANNLLK
jgi:acyl-CoA thioesterase-1